MTASTFAALAAICALLAYGITLDAMLNTNTKWHAIGFFFFSIGCIAFLIATVWRFFK